MSGYGEALDELAPRNGLGTRHTQEEAKVEEPKPKTRARVKTLKGRVIESAIIHYANPNSSQEEDKGPSFELKVSGGYTFVFQAQMRTSHVPMQAEVSLCRADSDSCNRAIVTETMESQ
jgi:hypothetical protein